MVILKPDIPPDIAANYKSVKAQWTQKLVATQQQKTKNQKRNWENQTFAEKKKYLKNMIGFESWHINFDNKSLSN